MATHYVRVNPAWLGRLAVEISQLAPSPACFSTENLTERRIFARAQTAQSRTEGDRSHGATSSRRLSRPRPGPRRRSCDRGAVRGPGFSGHTGGTGIVWAADLVITSSFHTPDRTTIGIGQSDGTLDERDAEDRARRRHRHRAVARDRRRPDAGEAARCRWPCRRQPRARARPTGSHRARLAARDRCARSRHPNARRRQARSLHRIGSPDPTRLRGRPADRRRRRGDRHEHAHAAARLDLAIPVATLRRVVDELQQHGGVRRGYLGVGAYPASLPAPLAQLVGRDRGALVASIEDGGPAATAGGSSATSSSRSMASRSPVPIRCASRSAIARARRRSSYCCAPVRSRSSTSPSGAGRECGAVANATVARCDTARR